jgi:two-component system chemotaxis response regulator CheB
MIVIASSTGGPNALAELIPRLPGNLPVPVLIGQHMPPEFTKSLAERLNSISPLAVNEARRGDLPKAGQVLIAPGDYHMLVEMNRDRGVVVLLNQDAPENSCRPAADVLFRSAARSYGENLLGVVLTGMGKDGLAGSRNIVDAGGRVIAQDEATSVVWGMPGVVSRANLADAILPLTQISDEIIRRTKVNR